MEESREADYVRRDRAIMAQVMNLRFFPLVVESCQGATLRDVDGREYLDFTACWAVANTGYGHPRVVAAVRDEIGRGSTCTLCSVSTPSSVQLAERLAMLLPGGFQKKVWFGHSGSEAGDLIAKYLTIAKGRPKTITFMGSFHGATSAAAALSGHTAQPDGVKDPAREKVPYPNPYRYQGDVVACCEEHLDVVKQLLEKGREDYAGIVVEPILSDGGVIVPPDGFLDGLDSLCDEYDLLYVIDEVKTGYARSGRMFAFQHSNAIPDAVMLGKPMASGVPLSAVVGRPELLDAVPHGHLMTTAGNPVACTAGLVTLDIIRDERLADRAERLGAMLLNDLKGLLARYPVIGDVRGKGLHIGVELVVPGTKEPNAELAARFCYRAKELGLVVFYVGTSSNVLEITPPLTITEEEIARGVGLFEQALVDAQAGKVSDADLANYAGW